MLLRSQNFAEGVKAEIDQQAKILRLEKELETARKHLFSMRKQKYAESRVRVNLSMKRRPNPLKKPLVFFFSNSKQTLPEEAVRRRHLANLNVRQVRHSLR